MGPIKQLRDVRGLPPRTVRRTGGGMSVSAAPARPIVVPEPADLEPIEGVSLALYAEISKCLAAVGYDQAQAPAIAATKGVAAGEWERAASGWNARIRADPSIARRFNQLYVGA